MRRFGEFFNNFVFKHIRLSIIMIYNITTAAVMIIFYPLVPILMGYFSNFREISARVGASYDLQYLIIGVLTVFIGTIVLILALKRMGNLKEILKEKDEKKISVIRKKCINLPYYIYIGQVMIVSLIMLIVFISIMTITKAPIIVPLKVFTIVFSLLCVIGTVSHIFSKKVFTIILLKTYSGQELQGLRINIKNKIFMQIIPMLIVAILFTSILAYSRLIEEKGDLLYITLKEKLSNEFSEKREFSNEKEVFGRLKSIRIDATTEKYFVVNKKDGLINSEGFIPSIYFKYFINNPVGGDRIFGDTIETQGVITDITINGEKYYAGVRFENASIKTINFFLVSFFALLLLNIFVLYYFSRSLAGEIALVADNLNDIAEGEQVDLDRKLAVVSNDELADLVIAFNKIQEREKEHIREIEEKHAILIAQERLATLGHLIGGIAHNLRTPIMSISGAIEGLKDLIEEYDSSIDDRSVSSEDHHEIAKEMQVWLEKMRPYCAYMSDIITAVKGQAMKRSNEPGLNFTLHELEKRIAILFEYELKKQHCKLNTVFNIDVRTRINGDISDLIQILNNLIINAVDSYDGRGGNIDLIVNGSNKVIEFIVKDYGKGIPLDVQSKLFKEMFTTKGKNGTGLGLYMSYSNIKARFGGKMRFESEAGKGTTFYIYIPINREDEN